MSRRPIHSLAARRPPLAPRAFTFIEVLFAIIILGIGSIMIAGMLPVAIKQTSDTRNAITGKAACEAGYAYIQAIATSSNLVATNTDSNTVNSTTIAAASMPQSPGVVTNVLETPATPTAAQANVGKIIPLSYALLAAGGNGTGPFAPFQSTIGSRVLTSDPRTQWLAFYGRSLGSNTATLVMLALHLQNTEAVSGYVQTTPPVNTLTNVDASYNDANGPFLLNADIVNGGALDPDKITLTNPNGGNGLLAADTGAFVIVANNYTTSATDDPLRGTRNNGRVFRLGKLVSSTTNQAVYELQPGYDLPPLSYGPDNVPNTADDVVDISMDSTATGNPVTQVWVVGKGLQNPAAPYSATSNPYVGLVQDVGVLTTQLPLSN